MKITAVRAVYHRYQHVVPSWRTYFWQIVARVESDAGDKGYGWLWRRSISDARKTNRLSHDGQHGAGCHLNDPVKRLESIHIDWPNVSFIQSIEHYLRNERDAEYRRCQTDCSPSFTKGHVLYLCLQRHDVQFLSCDRDLAVLTLLR